MYVHVVNKGGHANDMFLMQVKREGTRVICLNMDCNKRDNVNNNYEEVVN